jgi:peroxiredoxin Q/BCP
MLEPGTAAPDFEVKDQTGQTRRLSDYRGQNVVLWFYPKADTPG